MKLDAKFKEDTVTTRVVDVENSKLYCDRCSDEIKHGERFYQVITGHYDWGHDSIESVMHRYLCSNDCLKHELEDYISQHGLNNRDTQFFELYKKHLDSSMIKYLAEDDCYGGL